jgi:glycosyltransferase involved in cell wall biosynthesis
MSANGRLELRDKLNECGGIINRNIDKAPYRLSVLLVTYNHEKYIRQALDSILGQEIEGPVELVVADDCSSDKTLNIIKEYEADQNRFEFRYLDNTGNVGVTKNYQRGFAACMGKYVAVLEGDDYWISPLKLQRQMDFLDSHWECDCCAVNHFAFDESSFCFSPKTAGEYGYRLVSARDLIAKNFLGNFSTFMYRKSVLDALPKKLFDMCSYDWIVNICVAKKCMIGFLEEQMSVYRVHSCGVWSGITQVQQLKLQLEMIPAYDELTEYVYHSDFALLSNRLKHMILVANCRPAATKVITPFVPLLSRYSEYLPPVLLSMAEALTPPILKRFIHRILRRGAA